MTGQAQGGFTVAMRPLELEGADNARRGRMVIDKQITDLGTVSGQEVDDARGHPCLRERRAQVADDAAGGVAVVDAL